MRDEYKTHDQETSVFLQIDETGGDQVAVDVEESEADDALTPQGGHRVAWGAAAAGLTLIGLVQHHLRTFWAAGTAPRNASWIDALPAVEADAARDLNQIVQTPPRDTHVNRLPGKTEAILAGASLWSMLMNSQLSGNSSAASWLPSSTSSPSTAPGWELAGSIPESLTANSVGDIGSGLGGDEQRDISAAELAEDLRIIEEMTAPDLRALLESTGWRADSGREKREVFDDPIIEDKELIGKMRTVLDDNKYPAGLRRAFGVLLQRALDSDEMGNPIRGLEGITAFIKTMELVIVFLDKKVEKREFDTSYHFFMASR